MPGSRKFTRPEAECYTALEERERDLLAQELERGRVDLEVLHLCRTLNAIPGIVTNGSCSGHGKEPLTIWFYARSLRCLYPLARCLDRRYGGPLSWRCEVQDTDLPDRSICFLLHSGRVRGRNAWHQAEILATAIDAFMANAAFRDAFGLDPPVRTVL